MSRIFAGYEGISAQISHNINGRRSNPKSAILMKILLILLFFK